AQGGRGDSPLFSLTWQSPMLEESLWSLSQGRYNSAFPPSGRIYSTGYLMVDYLTRHYGKESFARVNTAFTWFPFFGLNGALKKETGFSSKALFALAIEEQRTDLPQSLSLGEQFSPESFGDFFLPTSTELGLVGYSHTLDRGGALVRYTAEGTSEELLSLPYIEGDSIAITVSQALFAFVWSDPFHPSSIPLAPVSYRDLVLYDFSSDSFTRLTHKAMLSQPAISPDGTLLVAIERTGDRHTLVRIDQETGESSLLYDNPLGSVFEPVILEDNSTIVVVEIVEGNSSLLAIDREGGVQVLVPPTRSEIRSPVYPDNESLLFVSDNAGYLDLYSYDFSTGKIGKLLSDPQGILGARIEGDDLLYETYRAQGQALKRVPLALLTHTLVEMQGPLSLDPASTPPEQMVYSSKSFLDYPRLNLVLPFPFVSENRLQPGLWLHSQSLLRRQTLTARMGWDIDNARLVGSFDYRYDHGSYAVGVQGTFDTEKRATASLTLPLLYQASLYNFKLLSLSSSLQLLVSQYDDILYYPTVLLGYQVKARSRPKDLFGAPFVLTSLALQARAQNSFVPDRYRLFGTLGGQVRMFSTPQMLGLQIDAVTDSKADLDTALLYEGFSDRGLDADAKARLTLHYHIPFGLLDLPIPYGGMTGLGLTLKAQGSLYLQGSSLLWDEEMVLSGRLTASAVLGSGLSLMPFASLAYRTSDGKFSFSVGLNGGALLVTEDTSPF
ncbi:MAG TPA: hypothetical protein VJ854_03660, partial [Sphaerochaeta sp.]|nr:hypothetical protein [Sphaerochaeta sp.]